MRTSVEIASAARRQRNLAAAGAQQSSGGMDYLQPCGVGFLPGGQPAGRGVGGGRRGGGGGCATAAPEAAAVAVAAQPDAAGAALDAPVREPELAGELAVVEEAAEAPA